MLATGATACSIVVADTVALALLATRTSFLMRTPFLCEVIMPRDEDDDLYDGEFDFVDDDEFDSEVDDSDDDSDVATDDETDEKPVKKRKTAKKKAASGSAPRKKVATPAPKKKATKKKSSPRKKKTDESEDDDEDVDNIPANAFATDTSDDTLASEAAQEVTAATEVDDDVKAIDSPDTSETETEGDEYGRVEPKRDFVVHVYEHRKFHRTLAFEFTPEDAVAFADTFNKTGRPYGRFAVPSRNDSPAKPQLAP